MNTSIAIIKALELLKITHLFAIVKRLFEDEHVWLTAYLSESVISWQNTVLRGASVVAVFDLVIFPQRFALNFVEATHEIQHHRVCAVD